MDTAALTEKRSGAIRRVTIAGLVANVLLGALKCLAGWFGHSQAVLADGIHSLGDLISDVAILVGVRFWSKPRDESHPYGHGRMEQVVTVFLALVLGGTGMVVGYRALVALPEGPAQVPTRMALWVALASIVTKELLYQWTARAGHRNKSAAVVANAWHHRSDALSSIPAALSVGVAIVEPSWLFVDHIGAVIVALFILQAAARIAFPSLRQLVDTAPPRRLRQAVLDKARAAPGVDAVHELRTRYVGPDLAMDLHVEVDPNLTVREGHDIAERVSEMLQAEFSEIVDVVVHLEPRGAHHGADGQMEPAKRP